MSRIEVHVPVATQRVAARPLAARPGLSPAIRLGLLDNRKANAGALLDGVAAALVARHGVHDVEVRRKDATAAAPPTVMAHLRGCHAVVLAIAD